MDDLLTSGFLSRNTRFSSFEALLKASSLSADQFSDLELQSDSKWEAFIQQASRFRDWNAMLRAAQGEWVMRRLGLTVEA